MRHFFTFSMIVALLPMAAWAETTTARSFAHSVTEEASRIEPPSGDKSYVSIRCWQATATPVYVGGKDVTPTNGYAICTDTVDRDADLPTCQSEVIALDVSNLYAVTSRPHRAPNSPALQSLSCIIVQGATRRNARASRSGGRVDEIGES